MWGSFGLRSGEYAWPAVPFSDVVYTTIANHSITHSVLLQAML